MPDRHLPPDPARERFRRRVRAWLVGAIAALVLLGGGAVLLGARAAPGKSAASPAAKPRKDASANRAPAAPVELTEVRRGNISTWLQTTASLEARNSAVLVARRQGQVLALQAEEGAWVE